VTWTSLSTTDGFSWFGPRPSSTPRIRRALPSNVRSALLLGVAAIAPGWHPRTRKHRELDSMVGHVGLPGGAAYGQPKPPSAPYPRLGRRVRLPESRQHRRSRARVHQTASPDRIEKLGQTTLMGRAAQVERSPSHRFVASTSELHHCAVIPVDGGRTAILIPGSRTRIPAGSVFERMSRE